MSDGDEDKPKKASLIEVKPQQNNLPDTISLGNDGEIQLSGLDDEAKKELVSRYAEAKLDVAKKAAEMAIETQQVNNRIGDIANNVAKANQDQSSATVTGSYSDNLGHTEVIIGNTERAAKGKLTKSQSGSNDYTVLIVAILVIGAVLIVAAIL